MRQAILEIPDDDIVVQTGVVDFAGHAYGSRLRTHVRMMCLVAHLRILVFVCERKFSGEDCPSGTYRLMTAKSRLAFFHEGPSAFFVVIAVKNGADVAIQVLKITCCRIFKNFVYRGFGSLDGERCVGTKCLGAF